MKQAYLIIAHKDDLTFRTLISMLDNENNDIFIHMDKKSKNYDEESIEYSCAVTPQVRQTGNRLSGLAGTAYASLLT